MSPRFTAAILERLNAPLTLDELEAPTLDVGQVLVRVHRSSICGAQLGEIAGVKGDDPHLPHLLGHEGAGVVEAIGPGVTQVTRGDHVVLHWRKGAGIQAAPPRYRCGTSVIGGGWVTTFNEWSVVSENRVTAVPESIPFEIAALMGCAVTTGLGVVNNDAAVKIGESVAVLGCGGVGLTVLQGAAMVAANPIIGIDVEDGKLKMAREFGATHIVNSRTCELQSAIRSIVGRDGVDVFIETTGTAALIEDAYHLTARTGCTIVVGTPRRHETTRMPCLALQSGKRIVGSDGGQANPTVDIPRYLRLYLDGRLNLDRLITHRFPLSEINAALDTVRSGVAGRCALQMA